MIMTIIIIIIICSGETKRVCLLILAGGLSHVVTHTLHARKRKLGERRFVLLFAYYTRSQYRLRLKKKNTSYINRLYKFHFLFDTVSRMRNIYRVISRNDDLGNSFPI